MAVEIDQHWHRIGGKEIVRLVSVEGGQVRCRPTRDGDEFGITTADLLAQFEYVPSKREQNRLFQQRAEAERMALIGPPPSDLDDAGYKPTRVDRLLTGTARATGQTAKAVRRGKTVTKHDYEKDQG